MKKFVCLVLVSALLMLSACKGEDIVKSLSKGIEVLDTIKKSLEDAEAKQLLTPGSDAKVFAFLEQTRTHLTQAKTTAESVAALTPEQRKNIFTILSAVRASLNDLDLSDVKDVATKRKIQGFLLGFGTGVDAMKIALQE